MCLALFRRGKSLHRCENSSKGFRTAHSTLFEKANELLLGNVPVSPMDYSCIVIRVLFCDTHSKPANFKRYFECIHPNWKGDGNIEEKELLEAIRQAHALPNATCPAPAIDGSRCSPLPISNPFEITSRVNGSGSPSQPIISCTPASAGTANSGEHTQSLPRLDLSRGSSRELRTQKPFPSSSPFRQTRSRSNPPHMNNDSHPRARDSQLSNGSSRNNTNLQSSPYNFSHPISQIAIPGPKPNTAIPTAESSSELPVRGFFSPPASSGPTRYQSNPSPLSKSFNHPQEADVRPGPETTPSNTTQLEVPGYCNSPSKSTFDFSFLTPSKVTDSRPRTADTDGLELFPPISGPSTPSIHRPGLHEQPKAATEPVVPRPSNFPNAVTLPVPPGPVYDASRQGDPTMARGRLQPGTPTTPSPYSPTDGTDSSNWNECLNSLGSGGDRLKPNKMPSRQTSKDDTFLEQIAASISAGQPSHFNASTQQSIDPKSIAERVDDPLCPTSVDWWIRRLIIKNVSKDGDVYILKAPKYFRENFPNHPPLLKIGMTTDLSARKRTLIRDCGLTDLEIVAKSQMRACKSYWRIEELVHCELQNFRRVFKCKKCTSKSGSGTNHQEWFAVSEEVAVQTVERWRKFIEKEPYDENGILKDCWSRKIQLLHMPHPDKNEEWDDSQARETRWMKWLEEG